MKTAVPVRAMVRQRMVSEVEHEDLLAVEEEALLLRQCRLNKVELVEKMIDSGRVGPNFTFSNGDTLLMVASKCGHRKLLVRFVFKPLPTFCQLGKFRGTNMFAMYPQISLIQRGADLDLKDRDGNSAAHLASGMGFTELTDVLISTGANGKATNNLGFTCRNCNYDSAANGSINEENSKYLSSPSSQQASPQKGNVHLPALTPKQVTNTVKVEREDKDGKSRSPLMQGPRPGGGRARKKVRTRDMEPNIYQQMYLVEYEARSQSTPPSDRHESDDCRPNSSCGRLDSANAGNDIQPLDKSTTSIVRLVNVGTSKSKSPVLKAVTEKMSEAEDILTSDNKVVELLEKATSLHPRGKMSEDDEIPGLTSIQKFVREGGNGNINEPFSVEAMRKLGIVQEQLSPINRAELKKKFKDDKVVEVRFKLLEERRQELLSRVLEERRRLRARSKDASMEELFVEYSGDMQMNISEYMDMLSKLGLLSEGGDKPGKLGKTTATNIFRAFAQRIGKTFEITWEQFVKMEKQVSESLGIKSIRCQEKVKKAPPIMTPGRGGEALPVALSKHNFTVEDRLEEVRKKDERNKEIELKRIEKNFGRVLEVRAKTQAYKEQIKRLETERLARLEAKSFECAMHRLGTILSWQHH